MNLEELRRQIDDIDEKIIRLLAERQQNSKLIGELKAVSGQAITDSARERSVIDHVRQTACLAGLDSDTVEHIYRLIISASKSQQICSKMSPQENADCNQQTIDGNKP